MYIRDFKITLREVIFSVIIACIMLILGFFISDKITDSILNSNQVYDNALKIENKGMFDHAYNTNAGNSFVKIDVEASEPQRMDDITGEYMYIERIYEEEHRKSRKVTKTKTNSDGERKTYTETEYYWEWDVEDRSIKRSNNIKLNGIEIPFSSISGVDDAYLELTDNNVTSKAPGTKGFLSSKYVYKGSHKRWSYKVIPKDIKNVTGYLSFGVRELKPASNRQHIEISYEESVNDLYQSYRSSNTMVIVFWIFWGLLTIGSVIGFCILDNKWLEDKEMV